MDSQRVRIIEDYGEYSPPVNVRRRVMKMLKVVPSEYLSNLDQILLTSTKALTSKQKKEQVRYRGRNVKVINSNGMHTYDRANRRGKINLYVDNIFEELSGGLIFVPGLANMNIAKTLFHEVGHHIEKLSSFRKKDDEDDAEKWESHFTRKYRTQHYWHLSVIYQPICLIYKFHKNRKITSNQKVEPTRKTPVESGNV